MFEYDNKDLLVFKNLCSSFRSLCRYPTIDFTLKKQMHLKMSVNRKKIIILLTVLGFISLRSYELNYRPPLLFPPLSAYSSGKKIPMIPADKSGKTSKIPTSWGGGELIQEEKIFQGIPVTAYSLAGGAYIIHRKVKLTASHIEIIGSDAIFGTLKGNVRIEDTENKILLTSERGIYDKAAETVVLQGRPTLYYYNNTNKLTKLTSPKIIRYMKDSKITLEEGVIVQDPDYTILSENAEYLEKEGLLKLSDNPLLFGKDIFLTANTVGYNNQTKVTFLEENTLIVQKSKEIIAKENQESENIEIQNEEKMYKDVLTFFSGDKMESYSKDKEKTETIILSGNAKVVREDFLFTGDHLKAFGESYKNLESKESFEFIDKKSHIKITGNLFEHDEEKGYTHITEEPKIEFQDDKGNINSTLTTVEIERFIDKKEIVARGNVLIQSDNGNIRGQYATYYEDEKKMYVEGNPSLERDGSKVFCGLIIVYPETNQIIMSDGIGVIKEK